MKISVLERFWSKVNITQGCWEWQSAFQQNGYGILWDRGGNRLAHRFAYEMTYGKILKGLWVLHKCDNKKCIRPSHLFLGDGSDNVHDALLKGRHAIEERHGLAKLTRPDVIQIRKSNDSGVMLAKRFGVTTSTVSCVRRRKTWRTVA